MAATYGKGTVQAKDGFSEDHIEKTCKHLHKSLAGLGTNEQKIIQILAEHNNDQRQQIKATYKTMFGQDLVEDLKADLCGDFEDLCVALLVPSNQYDAVALRQAIKSTNTSEKWLIELLCPQTNATIQNMKEQYQAIYKSNVEEDIKGCTSGNFEKILVSMLQAQREEDEAVDPAKVEKDATNLFNDGEQNRLGTAESTFNMILAKRSISHLRAVFEKYKTVSAGTDIEDAIKKETMGDLEAAYLAIVRYAKDPTAYWAERFQAAFSGCGTDEDSLIRLVVSHVETDLDNIKTKFKEMTSKTMATAIKDECSGDLRKLLLKLVGE